jgi:excinuclease ABC subunit A
VDKGNTIIVIEHNLEVIKTADHIIDMGPEGGEKGGKIIAEGSPEVLLVKFKNSYTSQYLYNVLRIEDKIKRKTLQK